MMGIPIDEPTDLFFDNKAVVRNSTMSESTLKKEACYYLLSLCTRSLCVGHDLSCRRSWSYKCSVFIDKEFTWFMIQRFSWMNTLL